MCSEELHDATLVSLEVDWIKGELRCNFKISIGGKTDAQILAHGLRSLDCPRLHPWGRSISVNDVRVEKMDHEVLLVIEMQSGDVIEATAQDLILDYI